jgi:hypothetical protein
MPDEGSVPEKINLGQKRAKSARKEVIWPGERYPGLAQPGHEGSWPGQGCPAGPAGMNRGPAGGRESRPDAGRTGLEEAAARPGGVEAQLGWRRWPSRGKELRPSREVVCRPSRDGRNLARLGYTARKPSRGKEDPAQLGGDPPARP